MFIYITAIVAAQWQVQYGLVGLTNFCPFETKAEVRGVHLSNIRRPLYVSRYMGYDPIQELYILKWNDTIRAG